MPKFKIEKGFSAPKRGVKAKYADYSELVKLLPQMEPGDSIKIVEVPETQRNSSYNSINGILQRAFEGLPGSYYVGSAKLDKEIKDDNGRMQTAIELRVYRLEEEGAPKKGGRKK